MYPTLLPRKMKMTVSFTFLSCSQPNKTNLPSLIRRLLISPAGLNPPTHLYIIPPLARVLDDPLARPEHCPLRVGQPPRAFAALEIPLVDRVALPAAPAHALGETRTHHGLEDDVCDARGALRALQDGEFVEVGDWWAVARGL